MHTSVFVRLSTVIACVGLLPTFVGCSSLGLSLWPSQMPILAKAKQFAAASPTATGLTHELAKQPIPDYFVESGDRLLVEPTRLDSEFQSTGDQLVMVDGSVDLGKFGRIRVAGLTVEEIEVAIIDRVEEASGKRESINVQLLETNASTVYVLGAVGSPGSYSLAGNETVLDAILLAGGLTSQASPCDILFVRPTNACECRVVQRICYRQITQLGDVATNFHLQPGDRIVVGARTLKEELAFWNQSKACPCCDRSNCVERQPARVSYQNRYLSWVPGFGKPESDDQVAADPNSGLPGNGELSEVPSAAGSDLPPLPGEATDASFFLDTQAEQALRGDAASPADLAPSGGPAVNAAGQIDLR